MYLRLILPVLFALLQQGAAVAAGGSGQESSSRAEFSGAYDYASPHAAYGGWETLTAALYRKERPDFTWYGELGAFSRKEGKGMLAAAGAYKDWTDSLYTFTAVSAGTNAEYLPRARFDHAFNVKFGPRQQFVWLIGATGIRYHTPHRDFILSTGLTAYTGDWVSEYRIFRNISSPGSVESYSHLVSVAYGRERWQWTTAVVGFGKQAYQAVELAAPEQVSTSSFSAALKHRRWVRDDFGFIGEANYFDLKGSYTRVGLQLGVFYEF